VAATLQYLFEESILFALSQVKCGEIKNLCLTGGSMLNCNVNSRVLRESQFKRVHLFPGCGDDGSAAGAALWVNHHHLDRPRNSYSNAESSYLGRDYPQEETPDYEYIAKKISQGKIVAWFDGKSEIGPRALGHRSILADPRDGHNRDRLNFMLKNREWFRPYAPSVLKEHSNDWFDFDVESPFMLYTAQVKRPKDIPAVTHVDNSSRMQTVDAINNPNYYHLIKAFYEITGVPLLLNTSLNGKDEPIVESEQDAINFFEKVPVDMLVLSGEIIEREYL
jgi:carbamoyltransferase